MSCKTVVQSISAWVYLTVLTKKPHWPYCYSSISGVFINLCTCSHLGSLFCLTHWLCVANIWLTALSCFVYYSFMFSWLPWTLQIIFIINLSLFLNKCADSWPWISMSLINNKIILISVSYPCIVLWHLSTTICIHSIWTTDIYIKSNNLHNTKPYSQYI